ncbi:M61 family metallopeptidase [Thiorhodococcus mannitoliphagus]|uniref:M61 family metallopeptidase n=1 Tax=Thiorhodococcus mannitoliphagus TaxID=329406 RepID=A0A6P1DNY2_9GAMM|nr:PDZ domain-containing protein [Thiorhodococcus mannitoliphagus]NEX18903.1 M61 family metallopeptidase [Thiorhodococcus mannitoliphagus]
MSEPTPDASAVTYRIAPCRPRAHLFCVELVIAGPLQAPLELSMPAWIRGSYMIRDFARNIVSIAATDAEGCPLALQKQDKQTWLCPGVGAVRVRYEVFAWDLSVRAAHLDLTHAYFNGPSLLLRAKGLGQQPCRVELLAPDDEACAGWRVATSLRALEVDGSGFGLYEADSYEDLIDHPVEIGHFERLTFDVGAVPHQMVINGGRHVDKPRLERDLGRICAEHAGFFGELPIDRYLFLVTALGEGYGGLEHAFSTSLLCSRDDLPQLGTESSAASADYRRFLGLCSHEYFHLWHVKRIRPQVFAEATLEQEAHTRLLWVFEGITSYYDELALVRSGCVDQKAYLGMLAETITRVMRTPGRRLQTLAESSFDAWTKFYKQDENAPNAIVSYYAKGALAALGLDLEIRRQTQGRSSLDEVMRALWQRHGKTDLGLPERGFETLAMEVTGLDLRGFFAQVVDSTEDFDLASLLRSVGIEMRLRPQLDAKDLGGCVDQFEPIQPSPTLALRLRSGVAEAIVQNVLSGGAGEDAGIAPGDVLIAVDGLRVTPANLDALVAIGAKAAGEIQIHLFRRDALMQVMARPQPAERDTCELQILEPVSESVAQARSAWLASRA